MKVGSWLFDHVQDDLKTLQSEYKKIGYNLTLEQCYEAWYMYSERCFANWLNVSNVKNSIGYVQKVLET